MTTETIFYTEKERTEKKYTVNDAVNAATTILRAKGIKGTCMDKVRGYSMDDKITLEKLNQISEAVIDDTMYWEGRFC